MAGVITGLGWIFAAFANTRIELYIAYAFGALGPGYIYCNCVNNALKWFPESRGRGTAVGLIDMGFGLGSATFSRIPNGVMRWVSGTISDYFGRERLMFTFFVLMGVFTYLMTVTHVGWAFVLVALLAMGCWGPLFTLYPALVSDYWGRKNSGISYGLIYGPGKGLAGVFAGTIAASLHDSTGSWTVPFEVAAALAIVSGLMALALRRPKAVVPANAPAVTAHCADRALT